MTPDFAWLERVLWVGSIACELALIIRLWRQELHGVFRYFWWYLIADSAGSGLLFLISPRSTYYGLGYFGTEFAKLALLFLLVLNLCDVTLSRYPSIAIVGRRAVQIAFSIGVALSLLAAYLESSLPKGEFPLLFYAFVALRSGIVVLAVATVLVFLFLTWFPVRMSRNAIHFLTVFVLYLASKAALIFAFNSADEALRRYVSTAVLALAAGCTLAWLFGMRREGETVSAVVAKRNPEQEQVLISQLDAINASLLRIAGK
jgi:hypothetical protein